MEVDGALPKDAPVAEGSEATSTKADASNGDAEAEVTQTLVWAKFGRFPYWPALCVLDAEVRAAALIKGKEMGRKEVFVFHSLVSPLRVC